MSDTEDTKPNDLSNRLRTSKNVTLAFKLNGKNYPLWSRLMKVQIGSRRAYSFITDDPPESWSKGYRDWEETDLIVFSWIVDNIENDIVADFAHHQTSKAIWDSLAVTFESKADLYLIYELEEKASEIKQGDMDLETYYRKIHGMWIDVDRCQKKPIDCCDKGINQYRVYSNIRRLFKFLAGLSVEYDAIRRDVLNSEPIPSVETAYGWVKREAARRRIMSASPQPSAGVNDGIAGSGEIGLASPLRINIQTAGTDLHEPPQPPTDQETNRTSLSFGVPTVDGINTHVRSASSELGIRNGGMRSKRQEPRLNSPSELTREDNRDRQSRGAETRRLCKENRQGITRKLHLVGEECVVSETSPRWQRKND